MWPQKEILEVRQYLHCERKLIIIIARFKVTMQSWWKYAESIILWLREIRWGSHIVLKGFYLNTYKCIGSIRQLVRVNDSNTADFIIKK